MKRRTVEGFNDLRVNVSGSLACSIFHVIFHDIPWPSMKTHEVGKQLVESPCLVMSSHGSKGLSNSTESLACLTPLDTSERAKFTKLGRWIHASNAATQEPLRDVSVEQGTLAEMSRNVPRFSRVSKSQLRVPMPQDRSAMHWKTSRFGDSEINASMPCVNLYQLYFHDSLCVHSARQSFVYMLYT